jgi:tellurite resistance protein
MSNGKAVANFESTQVIGIIEKRDDHLDDWVDADRMRASHRFRALGNKSELAAVVLRPATEQCA